MDHVTIQHANNSRVELLIIVVLAIAALLYIGAALYSSYCKPLRKWPLHRYCCFVLGAFCIGLSLIGPFAHQMSIDFTFHMLGHLLLGMLSPLLIALAAPITLLLRTIPVTIGRRIVAILHSWLLRVVSHPIVAATVNIGGLWLLYRTNLYEHMQSSTILHWLVHFHIFLAGYIFTVSMIYIDPTPHRFSYLYRAIVFIIALAGHGILAKSIYRSAPIGVDEMQAMAGGVLMYYGGDVIDAMLIFIFCLQWYRATRAASSSWA